MRTTTFSALTAKVVAGLAAATIVAGSAGTVLLTQTVGNDRPAGVKASAEETTTTTAADGTTTTSTTAADGSTTTTEAPDDGTEPEAGSKTEAEAQAHPENFGAVVSADARDGGVDGQEIAAAAQTRNAERRGSRPHPATQPATAAEVEADDDDAPGAGHGKQK